MKAPAHIEITNNGLNARCAHCLKVLIYKRGVHVDTWNRMLKTFTEKHRECKRP